MENPLRMFFWWLWISYLMFGKAVCASFLDFHKVFDSLDRRLLLDKLFQLNIHPDVLKWFQNYLTDCWHHVKGISGFSEWRSMRGRIPQGSTLGPLLFLIYVNDLPSQIYCCSMVMILCWSVLLQMYCCFDEFAPYVSKVCQSMSLNKQRLNFKIGLLKLLKKSLVLSHLVYCLPVWGPPLQCLIEMFTTMSCLALLGSSDARTCFTPLLFFTVATTGKRDLILFTLCNVPSVFPHFVS